MLVTVDITLQLTFVFVDQLNNKILENLYSLNTDETTELKF